MLIPLILSGGSGTRLWPVSREAHPKPFIKLVDGRSLLQKTVDRLAPLEGIAEVITVTNRDHYFVTRDEYVAGGAPYRHFFVLEPSARNTAPALAAGALAAADRGIAMKMRRAISLPPPSRRCWTCLSPRPFRWATSRTRWR